jgi:hypothetical protein
MCAAWGTASCAHPGPCVCAVSCALHWPVSLQLKGPVLQTPGQGAAEPAAGSAGRPVEARRVAPFA